MLASALSFHGWCCSSAGLCQKPSIYFPVNEYLFRWFAASMFFYHSEAAVDILFTVTCCKGQVCVWYSSKSITLGSQGMHIFKCNGQHLILFQCGFFNIHSTTMRVCLLHVFHQHLVLSDFYILEWIMVSCCCLTFNFPDYQWGWVKFCVYQQLMFPLLKNDYFWFLLTLLCQIVCFSLTDLQKLCSENL